MNSTNPVENLPTVKISDDVTIAAESNDARAKTTGTTDIIFPDINAGVANDFSDAYAEITEAPRHFYLMAFLACLGSILSDCIRIRTILKVNPRLYLIFLGVSGRGRKSTPINLTSSFFKDLLPDFSLMHHANSGEGLGVFLEKHPCTLLVFDEFMGFVSKAGQKGNTLLGTVTSLFEKNEYQTATKDKQLLIENANLSLLAACTTDTWERCWSVDFTAIGLVNRLFLVPGNMDKLVPIPPEMNVSQWQTLRKNLEEHSPLFRQPGKLKIIASLHKLQFSMKIGTSTN